MRLHISSYLTWGLCIYVIQSECYYIFVVVPLKDLELRSELQTLNMGKRLSVKTVRPMHLKFCRH